MEKNKANAENGKNKKYPPKRIPQNQLEKLAKIGDGNWRQGLTKVLNIWDETRRDPTRLLQNELEHFGDLVRAFASDNHYQHYIDSNLSAMLLKFIGTGRVDHTILNKRPEKTIDKFSKDEDEEED